MPSDLPGSWCIKTVDQIALDEKGAISIGPFGSRMKSDKYVTDGVPVIRGNNLAGYRFFVGDYVYISEKTADELRSSNVFEGDLVFPHRGSIGDVGIVLEPDRRYMLSTSLMKLTCNPSVAFPMYVYYYFKSTHGRQQLLQNASQVGTPGIATPLTSLKQAVIILPPLDEQKEIVRQLSALDDKIELNRRLNRTLEELARGVFKAWFVDFEPVKAKASGATSFPGMPQDVFDQLPDTFVPSDLGLIPEGWDVVELGDRVDVVKGRSYKSSELAESETALVTLKSFLRGGGYREDGLKPYTGKFNPEQVIEPGEIVVAYTDVTQQAAVIGKPAVVRRSRRHRRLVASLDTAIVRPTSEDLPKSYLYCLFRTEDFQTHVYGYTSGTTVLHLSKDALPYYRLGLPPSWLLEAFNAIAGPGFELVDQKFQENEILAETRDTLLPKLISGELRVPVPDKPKEVTS